MKAVPQPFAAMLLVTVLEERRRIATDATSKYFKWLDLSRPDREISNEEAFVHWQVCHTEPDPLCRNRANTANTQ